MDKERLNQYRYFLKDSIRKKINFRFTDQNQGIAAPPIEEKCLGAKRIDLPGPDLWENIPMADITHAIGNRKSHRVYGDQPLALEELAAYDQEEMDELLGLDGDEAFAIYLAPVGKIKAK